MKKALVIGINNYPNQPLTGAINDATCISDLLKVNGNDTKNFEVKLALDVSTHAELLSLIIEFYEVEAEVGLLYFAGHGFVNQFGGSLVTPDHQRYVEGVYMNQILTLANNSPIHNNIIILDCCQSGAFGAPIVDGSVTPINSGITIMTSSRPNEAAVEINGHGLFTSMLLEGMNGGAADIRGHISPGGLYAFIDQALGAHEQRPVFKSNVSEFVEIRSVEPQVPLSVLRNLINHFEDPFKQIELDPSFEDTNYPEYKHELKKPYTSKENVKIFKDLQKLESVGLVVPIDQEFMYFAAMKSTACQLTPLGHHYWRLARDGKI